MLSCLKMWRYLQVIWSGGWGASFGWVGVRLWVAGAPRDEPVVALGHARDRERHPVLDTGEQHEQVHHLAAVGHAGAQRGEDGRAPAEELAHLEERVSRLPPVRRSRPVRRPADLLDARDRAESAAAVARERGAVGAQEVLRVRVRPDPEEAGGEVLRGVVHRVERVLPEAPHPVVALGARHRVEVEGAARRRLEASDRRPRLTLEEFDVVVEHLVAVGPLLVVPPRPGEDVFIVVRAPVVDVVRPLRRAGAHRGGGGGVEELGRDLGRRRRRSRRGHGRGRRRGGRRRAGRGTVERRARAPRRRRASAAAPTRLRHRAIVQSRTGHTTSTLAAKCDFDLFSSLLIDAGCILRPRWQVVCTVKAHGSATHHHIEEWMLKLNRSGPSKSAKSIAGPSRSEVSRSQTPELTPGGCKSRSPPLAGPARRGVAR